MGEMDVDILRETNWGDSWGSHRADSNREMDMRQLGRYACSSYSSYWCLTS